MLYELQPKPEPKLLEPKILYHPEIIRITPVEEEKQPILIAKITDEPKDGTWRKILLDQDPISITDITKVVSPTYLAPVQPGANGTQTIVPAPGSGYKLRLKGIQISVDGATRIDLRWGTTAFRSYYLPANGTIERNFVHENIEGGNNQALTLLCSAANVYVTASAETETLAI